MSFGRSRSVVATKMPEELLDELESPEPDHAEDIWAHVRRLPDELGAVITLKCKQHLSYEAVGRQLHISTSTVKKRRKMALEALRLSLLK